MSELPGWILWTLTAAFGAALGSFLNVCIYRWPAEQSVISPASRCPSCSTELAWRDNIPVIGWVLLRGRCRYCDTPVSVQYPIIELTVALIWIAAVARFGVTFAALHSALFLTILLGIAMTDAREMVIPDQFTLLGGAAGVLLALAPGGITFLHALLAAGLGYALLWAVKLAAERALGKPALGVGDIHMMLFVGAFIGAPGMLLTLMLGSLLGLLIGVPLTWLRNREQVLGSYLPLGTFLALGAAIAHVWGPAIIAGYLSFISA